MDKNKAENMLDEILSVRKEGFSINGYNGNLDEKKIVNVFGTDIYKMLCAISMYVANGNRCGKDIVDIIEDNKYITFEKIVKFINEFSSDADVTINDVPCLLVLIYQKYGLINTYLFLRDFLNPVSVRKMENGVSRYMYSRNKWLYHSSSLSKGGCEDNLVSRIAYLLSIDNSFYCDEQFEEAINSKLIMLKNMNIRANEALSIIGTYSLYLLSFEYIMSKYYDIDTKELFYLRGVMLNIEIVSKKIPYDFYQCLRKEYREILSASNGKFIDQKKDTHLSCIAFIAFKSIIGMLMVNYIDSGKEEIFSCCKKLLKKYANISFDVPVKDLDSYREFIYYFSETNNLFFYEFIIGGNFSVKISTKSQQNREQIKSVTNDRIISYKRIADEIVKHWNKHWLLKEELNLYINDMNNSSCYELYQDNISKTKNEEKQQELQKSGIKISHNEKVRFDDEKHVLYIMKKEPKCIRKMHNVTAVTGLLRNLKGLQVPLNINFCENCQRFYIYYIDYEKYCKKYGIMLGNISLTYMGFEKSNGTYKLSKESPLHFCGYNVNQTVDYSEKERHMILASIMDYGIMKKAEILEYLHFFIGNLGRRNNMKMAVSRWNNDLDYVLDYKIKSQKRYKIDKVRKT